MTLAFLLAAVAVIFAPLLLRQARQKSRTIVYRGIANTSIELTSDLGKYSKARYCWVDCPGQELPLLAEISPDKYLKLAQGQLTPVNVTVVRYPFGKPAVESVTWPDETIAESANRTPKIGAMCWYFLTGLGALVLALQWSKAGADFSTLATLTNYLSGILLAFAGFEAVNNSTAIDKPSEAKVELLGVNLGKGKRGLMVAIALATVLTIVSFTWINILTIVIGLNTAIAVGGLFALLLKIRKAAGGKP